METLDAHCCVEAEYPGRQKAGRSSRLGDKHINTPLEGAKWIIRGSSPTFKTARVGYV